MKINKKWHLKNKMPKNATLNQRIQWLVDHARECACRPIPKNIQGKLLERKPKLVVGILAKNKNKYLLAKETLEDNKDHWIVPGGKVEFGETIEQASKRELQEETSIKAKKLDFLCFKEAIFPEYNYHTIIFFFLVKTDQIKLGKDIEGKVLEANWFTPKEAKKLPLVDSAKWLFAWMNKQGLHS